MGTNTYGQPYVQRQWLQAGLDQITAFSYFGLYYAELPGRSGFSGNAAGGAALLNELQNSPLSGHFTAFNYYLQSAIDAGTLCGAETRVGG